jgi:tetratricopeptide (TPR) repeat protein
LFPEATAVASEPPSASERGTPAIAIDSPRAADERASGRQVILWTALATLVFGGGVGTAYFLMRPSDVERQALSALEEGNVVTPVGASALDLYRQLEVADPTSASLERIGTEALPTLVEELDAFYARWYATSTAGVGEWEAAERRADWALQLDPENFRVRAQLEYARGRSAHDRGDYQEALSFYEASTRAWPQWALPHNSVGVIHARNHDYVRAARAYEVAAGLDSSWAFPNQNAGAAYVELRRYHDAERALVRAIEIDDTMPRAHFLLGVAYAQQDRYVDAVREGERALQLDPGNESTGYQGNLAGLVRRWRARLGDAR